MKKIKEKAKGLPQFPNAHQKYPCYKHFVVHPTRKKTFFPIDFDVLLEKKKLKMAEFNIIDILIWMNLSLKIKESTAKNNYIHNNITD